MRQWRAHVVDGESKIECCKEKVADCGRLGLGLHDHGVRICYM